MNQFYLVKYSGTIAKKITVKGRVQGVGFRPFIYRLATGLGLQGWVRNTNEGVIIKIQGSPDVVLNFYQALKTMAPDTSRIRS
ncbi:MAG: acylphosphatase, partial [bacterium]